MKSYDKAAWHIDAGEIEADVIARFKEVFTFLKSKQMLNEEGLETLEFGMDSSVSLNSNMVNAQGMAFLDEYYDVILKQNPKEIRRNLKESYTKYIFQTT